MDNKNNNATGAGQNNVQQQSVPVNVPAVPQQYPPQGQQYYPPQGRQYYPPQGQQYYPPQGQQYYPGQQPQYYPQQPPPPKYNQARPVVVVQKKHGCLWTIGLIVVIILGLSLLGALLPPSGRSTNQAGSNAKTNAPKLSAIGDTIRMDGWEVVVHSFEFKSSLTSNFGTPLPIQEGSVFLVVNMTVKNTGDEADEFLSAAFSDNEVNVRYDGKYTYSASILSAYVLSDALCDASLNPLQQKTGIVAFPVPAEMENEADKALVLVLKDDEKTVKVELR